MKLSMNETNKCRFSSWLTTGGRSSPKAEEANLVQSFNPVSSHPISSSLTSKIQHSEQQSKPGIGHEQDQSIDVGQIDVISPYRFSCFSKMSQVIFYIRLLTESKLKTSRMTATTQADSWYTCKLGGGVVVCGHAGGRSAYVVRTILSKRCACQDRSFSEFITHKSNHSKG